MPKVQFTNTNVDVRKIMKSDWKSVGVDDQDAVTWDQSNGWTAEVSQAAADYLTGGRESDFKIADKPRDPFKPATTSATGTPAGGGGGTAAGGST